METLGQSEHLGTVEPEPADGAPHYYAHAGQEFNHVLEGTLKVSLDGHEVVLEEGDSLYFDSGVRHAMVAGGQKPVRFLAVIV